MGEILDEKYSVHQHSVSAILNWVQTQKIAIPEIQRPFVWNSTKVRDLVDSLYQGYPIGYLITWQSDNVKLKDGETSATKQILIDGQQRVTALTAALLGEPIVNKEYKKVRIQISFNPITQKFETYTPVLKNDPAWILDIADAMKPTASFALLETYMAQNPEADRETVIHSLTQLLAISSRQVGIIDLDASLDIETVTEIFIRINSKGVVLNSADFAMSKIASYGEYGSQLRKFIDYFCHLAVQPHFAGIIRENDPEFASTSYFKNIAWLATDSNDLYNPEYQDLIRVVGMIAFGRGRIDAVVSYLSGRDFETRSFEDQIALASFEKLEQGLFEATNHHNMTQFVMIIQSAGFIDSSMISSRNALNFAYALYLILRRSGELPHGQIQGIVRRWFVMSMLTGRHSGSFETTWELDLRRVREMGPVAYLDAVQASEMGDGFWREGLPISLVTSSSRSPYWKVFLASQIKAGAIGFLSKNITVRNMIEGAGDVHHIFPKSYLDKNGVKDTERKNQIANYVLTETNINISIGDRSPADYMALIQNQVESQLLRVGEITSDDALRRSLAENAIPSNFSTYTADTYDEFLAERRKLMAEAMRLYFESL
jgi:hypothetical protein